MHIKRFLLVASLLIVGVCHSQEKKHVPDVDTTYYDYDALFSELNVLLDSLLTPHTFILVNVGLTNGYFNYSSKATTATETKKKLLYSPSVNYFHKSGFGIGAGASVMDDGNGLNAYQFSATGSYDYIKKRSLITGVSLTHYFTQNNLSFYTSPLQNEAYGYFMYRKLWFKPSVGLSYGWGNRQGLEEREEQIQNIQLAQQGFTRINTKETVADFNLLASVRHDFYFMSLFSKHDFARITPQISFTSGTQQFGFNQTSNTYGTMRRTGKNVLYNTQNITFDNNLYFQPLSLTAYLKTEYSAGKFFVQPQVLFDYYFPAKTDNYTTTFIINAGMVL